MIVYSLNVALIIAISVAFYRSFLHRETFFGLNRLVLSGCLVLAFIIPLVRVPGKLSFRQAPPIESVIDLQVTTVQPAIKPNIQTTSTGKAAPKTDEVSASAASSTVEDLFYKVIKYIPFIYWAGVAIMGANLLLQIIVLLYRSRKNPVIKDGICRIIEVDGDRSPCSFANRIFINPEKYDWETYDQILAHEKIHVLQAHSIDLLLAELMLVFQWFNPLAWIYRKDIESNLEYLTDDSLLKKNDFERSTYQLSLVKVSVPEFAMNITTNYNQSLLKKRILMMNGRRSNINGMWKYMTLVLIMAVLVCNINEPLSAVASNILTKKANKPTEQRSAPAAGVTQPVQPLQLSKQSKIAGAKVDVPTVDSDASTGDKPTIPLKFNDVPGKLSTVFEGARIRVPFTADTVKADAAFVKAVGDLGYASLNQRQMDTLKSAGVTPYYINDMLALGYGKIPYKMLCILKLSKVTPEYIKSFSDLGYGQIPLSQMPVFKWSGIDAAYIQNFRKAGLELPLEAVSIFKASKVEPEYVKDLINLGYNAKYNQFILWKSQGITPTFISDFSKVGLNLPVGAVSIFKASKITPQYVKDLVDMGYKDLNYSRFLLLKSQGIDADYIKGFNKIGYNNIPVSDLSFLKMGNITPDYVADMKEKGIVFSDLKRYAFVKNQR